MARQQILIVDADVRSRRVLEVSLSKAGFSVILAHSAESAIELLAHAEPDLIISETMLPQLDGFGFFVEARDHVRGKSVPFVFLSSDKNIEVKVHGLELGAEDFWVKPVSIKEVITRVARLVRPRATGEPRGQMGLDLAGASTSKLSGETEIVSPLMGLIETIQDCGLAPGADLDPLQFVVISPSSARTLLDLPGLLAACTSVLEHGVRHLRLSPFPVSLRVDTSLRDALNGHIYRFPSRPVDTLSLAVVCADAVRSLPREEHQRLATLATRSPVLLIPPTHRLSNDAKHLLFEAVDADRGLRDGEAATMVARVALVRGRYQYEPEPLDVLLTKAATLGGGEIGPKELTEAAQQLVRQLNGPVKPPDVGQADAATSMQTGAQIVHAGVAGDETTHGEHSSQATDNRGATVTQQIVVHGNATFGAMLVGDSGEGGSSGRTTAADRAAPNPADDRLGDAYTRREALLIAGEDVAGIDAEILELRRALRRGPTLHTGEYLGDGRFKLLEVIGRGGFALVWKAYDTKDHQLVAVKVLHGELAREASRRERLFRGAKRMAALRHPNVVRVLVPEGEDEGFHYFVMEYVPGGDLHRAIIQGRVDAARALALLESMADALAVAHDGGLVHRDVKPENILLRVDGTAVLTDFDLVQANDTTGGTRTSAMGTVVYAAPEQSVDASRVDHRADVYGLGMTAVFCVHGKNISLMDMFNRNAFLAGLGCTMAIRRVLQRAVALKPEDRFGDVTSFRQALEVARRGVGAEPLQVKLPTERQVSKPAAVKETQRDFRRTRQAGRLDTKVVANVELVLVPRGPFLMGSPKDEVGPWEAEARQHEVELASFWLARTPVTNAQYREYMMAKRGVREPAYWRDEKYSRPDQPVVGVLWREAKAYCEWAGLLLPTEAQWEYACRAGTTTRYHSGGSEEDLRRAGWYSGNSDGRLHDVRELQPNDWGLYDMHGNVWELCEDAFGDYKRTPRAGDGLRHEPVDGAPRVMRGGSFGHDARDARSAFRLRLPPDERWNFVGFRPAQGHHQ